MMVIWAALAILMTLLWAYESGEPIDRRSYEEWVEDEEYNDRVRRRAPEGRLL